MYSNANFSSFFKVATVVFTFAFFLNNSVIAQENKIEVTFPCEDTDVAQEEVTDTLLSKVEVHAGNKVLKQDVGYKIEDGKIKIISEAYLQYSEPISISFQKNPPSDKEQPIIEGKQKK